MNDPGTQDSRVAWTFGRLTTQGLKGNFCKLRWIRKTSEFNGAIHQGLRGTRRQSIPLQPGLRGGGAAGGGRSPEKAPRSHPFISPKGLVAISANFLQFRGLPTNEFAS